MPVTLESVSIRPPRSVAAVVSGVSCALLDGTVTLVAGASGAGKSTLLRATAGVWPLASGHVRYDGTSLWSHRGRLSEAAQLRTGFVFQQPEEQLFAHSVSDEIRYSLRPYQLAGDVVESAIQRALVDLELDASLLEESPLLLSAGQRRRVALASTLATGADWLFLDEPTAGLDPAAAKHLLNLVRRLRTERRERGRGGIVIATHDLDALLPDADFVLLLAKGSVVYFGPPDGLCADSDMLVQAGAGVPERIELTRSFAELGWPNLPPLVDPTAFADAVTLRAALPGQGVAPSTRADARPAGATLTVSAAAEADAGELRQNEATRRDRQSNGMWRQWLNEIDPRAKWLFVILASAGVLVQNTWSTVAGAGVLVFCVAASAGLSARAALQSLKPLLIMAAASGVVSGLRFGHPSGLWHVGPVAYAFSAASVTLMQMTKVMWVVLLGALLSATTSTLEMKNGIEQGLRPLARLRLPVDAFALAAALMLRFVPVVLRETERFALIVRVRGKYRGRTAGLRLRDMPALILPLLLSVIRIGEDLSQAIEARGYKPRDLARSRVGSERRMGTAEWRLIGAGLLWTAAAIAVRHALSR